MKLELNPQDRTSTFSAILTQSLIVLTGILFRVLEFYEPIWDRVDQSVVIIICRADSVTNLTDRAMRGKIPTTQSNGNA